MLIINNHRNPNFAMLEFAARKLGPLKEEVIFVGGCTTALFITDLAAPNNAIRATDDVDCIVDVLSWGEYVNLSEKLKMQGFSQSMQDSVICRWRYDDLILDVMPADEKILSFSNRWYKEAIEYSVHYQLANNLTIKIISAPYFLATKLEAFYGRGKNDFLGSHDFEDIITVIDGRIELLDEISLVNPSLKNYFKEKFSNFLANTAFHLALPGHLSYGGAIAEARSLLLLQRIKVIAQEV